MSGIEIRNFEADDKTQFSTKNIRFNHNTLKTPFKTLDFNDVSSLKDIASLERSLNNLRHKWETEQLNKFSEREKVQKNDKWKLKYRPPITSKNLPQIKLPQSWIWVSPDEIKDCNDPYALAIGPFGSNLKVSDYQTKGVPLIFVKNIRSGVFQDDNTKYVSMDKSLELKPHVVNGGNVLITKMGDPPGDACLYPKDSQKAIITADCIKLNVSDEIQDPLFFVYAINSDIIKAQILHITKGVAQKKVSLERFKTIGIPLPPLSEQHEIVSEIERRFSVIDEVERAVDESLVRAESLRQSILKKAFEGKLVPQDPDDEPASVLLERILAEKKGKKEEAEAAKRVKQGKKSKGNEKEKKAERGKSGNPGTTGNQSKISKQTDKVRLDKVDMPSKEPETA